MSANFYELLKYAATGIASPDMTYYDRMRASTLMGAKVQTLTGQPPLTFKADGTPLISWSMKGNGSQHGTPTPDNPVMPEFVGVKTAQLFDIATKQSGIYLASNGNPYAETNGSWRSPKISVTGCESYTLSLYCDTMINIRILEWSDSSYIKNTPLFNKTGSMSLAVTLDSNTTKIAFNVEGANAPNAENIMLNSGTTALPYEPFGWAEKITCAGQTVPVYLGEVQTVRRIKKLVLDGTEDWQLGAGYIDGYVYLAIDSATGYAVENSEICSHFVSKRITSSNNEQGIGIQNKTTPSSMTAILVRYTGLTTDVQTFKAYLASEYAAGTPVTIWYVLANEQTGIVNEPLAKIGDYADELHSEDAGVAIPTVKGANVLTVDTPIQPSEMTITYKG